MKRRGKIDKPPARSPGEEKVPPPPQDRFQKEALVYDALFLFSSGGTISEISHQLKTSRQRVVGLLQEAFMDGLVQLPPVAPHRLTEELRQLFGDVEFRVVLARNHFSAFAARTVLGWLREICRRLPPLKDARWQGDKPPMDPRPYVAVGGGRALHNMIREIVPVLSNPTTDPAVRDWFEGDGEKLCYVNATTGGLQREPAYEASHLTCLLGQATHQRTALYSLSASPTRDEEEVIESAVKNTCAVVSGIGAPADAYCIRAIREKGGLAPGYEKELVGEFLFHLYDKHGRLLRTTDREQDGPAGRGQAGIEIKEDRLTSAGLPPGKSMLATLLRFESLKGRPAKNPYLLGPDGMPFPRHVMAVATCTPENVEAKARAAYVLLQHGYLTHLCISADLANAILTEARRP